VSIKWHANTDVMLAPLISGMIGDRRCFQIALSQDMPA